MFRAIGRYIAALGYLLTGNIDRATELLNLNPAVMKAGYDDVIREKTTHINEYVNAVSEIVANQESRKQKLIALTTDVQRLEKLKQGALAKAKSIAAGYTNDKAKCEGDPEYIKCQSAYKDFSSTLEEKNARIADLEKDIQAKEIEINVHKNRIISTQREIAKIKEERGDAVADVQASIQDKKISDTLSGLAQDKTSEQLQSLRDVRNKAKASASVSKTVAGLDAKAVEDDFMASLDKSEAKSEFDNLMGFGDKDKSDKTVAAVSDKLPEN